MTDIRRASDIDNPIEELFDDPAAPDERYQRDKPDLEARLRANLSLHESNVPDLGREEERELIRRAQAEAAEAQTQSKDEWAKKRRRQPLHLAAGVLVIHFHDYVRKIAREYFGDYDNSHIVGVMGSYEDRVAAGLLGLWEAIRRFDLASNSRKNRLNAHARHWIDKHVREECRLARKRGDSSDTRADRKVYDNRHLTAQQIAALTTRLLCSNEQWAGGVKAAQGALDRSRIYWHGHDDYHEGSHGDDQSTFTVAPKYLRRQDFMRHYDRFSYGQPSRESECLSRVVDALVVEQDRRDERRLKAIGRRAYAAWLWRRDIKRRRPIFPPEIQMAGYTISVNTASTASDSSDWKSDTDKLEAAAKVQPTVFDEKDRRWGWYSARRDHRPKNETYQPSAAEAAEGNDHDSFRQEQPRHQASRVRRANRDRRGDARSCATGHDHHERHHEARLNGGAKAARLSQG